MSSHFESTEFEDIARQIGKNAEQLRAAGKLQYALGKHELNRSSILCGLFPRSIDVESLGFNVHAHQYSERFIDPTPNLVLSGIANDSDLTALMFGVDNKKLILNAIENHRIKLHHHQINLNAGRSRIALSKANPEVFTSFKEMAEELIQYCLADFPQGSLPTATELDAYGINLEQYRRIFSDRETLIKELSQEFILGEGSDISVYQELNAREASWLEPMEAQTIAGKFELKVSSHPAYLLVFDARFREK